LRKATRVESKATIPFPEKRRSRLAAVIRAIESVGPDMTKVSKSLGEPKAKVSRIFRSEIQKYGYPVLARSNRASLGLSGMFLAMVDIAPEYLPTAHDVFDGMDDHWFLAGYARTMPEGRFILSFSLPDEHADEFPRLMDRIKKAGLVSDVYQTFEFSRRTFRPMSVENFDFRTGRWEFDWSRASSSKLELQPKTRRQQFDSMDLSVLMHMLLNSGTPIDEIANRLRIDAATAHLHARHIEEKHLIENYGIYWMKTHLDEATGMPRRPRHTFVSNSIGIRKATPRNSRSSMKRSVRSRSCGLNLPETTTLQRSPFLSSSWSRDTLSSERPCRLSRKD